MAKDFDGTRAFVYSLIFSLLWFLFSCAAVLAFCVIAGYSGIGNFKMPDYHIRYFYLYFGIIAFFYGVFLFLWLRRHSGRWARDLLLLPAIVVTISASLFPCAVLYAYQDMLHGSVMYEVYLPALADALPLGGMLVLISFPLNIILAAGFWYFTEQAVKRFDAAANLHKSPPFPVSQDR